VPTFLLSSSFSKFSARMAAVESSSRGHVWAVLAVILAVWIAAYQGKLGSTPLMDANFDAHRFPVKAVDFIEQSGNREPILSPEAGGGYLIYRLYPQPPVFLDDRHDLYGEALLKSYLRMIHLEPGWDEFLHDHQVKWVLLPRGSPLANLLT